MLKSLCCLLSVLWCHSSAAAPQVTAPIPAVCEQYPWCAAGGESITGAGEEIPPRATPLPLPEPRSFTAPGRTGTHTSSHSRQLPNQLVGERGLWTLTWGLKPTKSSNRVTKTHVYILSLGDLLTAEWRKRFRKVSGGSEYFGCAN